MVTTYQQGLKKAESYCAYQERSQREVREKLYALEMYPGDVEKVITELILTNFLNEERFARAYARGKFELKGWGKIKIKQGLKYKGVPDALIRSAFKEIDEDRYRAVAMQALEKKAGQVKAANKYEKKKKLQSYMLQKGFENELINELLAEMEEKK